MDITGEINVKVYITLDNEGEIKDLMEVLEAADESDICISPKAEKLRLKMLEVLRDHTIGL